MPYLAGAAADSPVYLAVRYDSPADAGAYAHVNNVVASYCNAKYMFRQGSYGGVIVYKGFYTKLAFEDVLQFDVAPSRQIGENVIKPVFTSMMPAAPIPTAASL